jgi:hypothetical protein
VASSLVCRSPAPGQIRVRHAGHDARINRTNLRKWTSLTNRQRGVCTNEKNQDEALLAFLMRGQSTGGTDDDTAATAQSHADDDVEAFLRAMRYNRHERERIRRGRSQPRSDARYRDVAPKRYSHYLSQALPDLPSDQIDRLAKAWVMLADYDVGVAQQWWAAGVDPRHPEQLALAIETGLRREHLGQEIFGQTVAEHLQAGSPLRWILGALGFSTSVSDRTEPRRSA